MRDAVGAIDKEIAGLRLAKSKLLSGDTDDELQTITAPTPPPALALPRDWPIPSQEKKSPLADVVMVPPDEQQFEALYRELREYGVAHMNKTMLDFREAPGGRLRATPTMYSEKQHFAWGAALGALWAEMQMTAKIAAEKRSKIEDQILNQVGWFNEIFKRLRECEKKTSVSYEGVFDVEREYAPGQLVTQDGSIFACLLPQKESRLVQRRTISSLLASEVAMAATARMHDDQTTRPSNLGYRSPGKSCGKTIS
jgi:hypothetical protein